MLKLRDHYSYFNNKEKYDAILIWFYILLYWIYRLKYNTRFGNNNITILLKRQMIETEVD